MAIDPKLVSIKTAEELPEGIPTPEGKFLYYEANKLMKSEMSDLYDRLESAYLGIITPSTTIPSSGSWYGNVLEDGTFNNVTPAITVTVADFDVENGTANNEVRIIISEGVASKDVRRVKGDVGPSGKTTEVWTAKVYDANSTVFSAGKIWSNPTATLATDVPSVSPKWVEAVDYWSKKEATIAITNKVINGNFSDATGWVGNNGVLSVSSNVGAVTGGNVSSFSSLQQQTIPLRYETARKIYIKIKYRVTNAVSQKVEVYLRNEVGNDPTLVNTTNSPVENQWYTFEQIVTLGTIGTPTDNMRLEVKQTYADIATATGKVLEVKEAVIVDVTADFPTATLSDFPAVWFNGVYVLKTVKSVYTEFDARISSNATKLNDLTKQATINVENKVVNGNFAVGYSPWVISTVNVAGSVANNVFTVTSKGIAATISTYQNIPIEHIRDKKVYIKATLRVRDGVATSIRVGFANGVGNYATYITQLTPNQDQWYTIDGLITVNVDFDTSDSRMLVQAVYSSAAVANGKILEIKNVLALDMAQMGNETPIEDVRTMLSTYPDSWFEGFHVIKTLSQVYDELKSGSGGGTAPSAYVKKQPIGILDNWVKIPNSSGTSGSVRTIGHDGYMYYRQSLRTRKLLDPVTGAFEEGIYLSEALAAMFVIPSGIVYIINMTDGSGTKYVEVRKAPNIQTVPVVISTLAGGHTHRIGCHCYYDSINEIIMVGGYEQTKDVQRFMYLSTNGGQTFTNVKTTIGSDNVYNWHWHAAAYDPYQGRIWISEGDDPANRAIWYSENMGVTWARINSNAYQPTLIIPFPNKVAFGRDQGYPGIDSYIRPKSAAEDVPVSVLEDTLTFRKDIAGAMYYPSEPIGRDGNTVYISMNYQGAGQMNYIYATGDGGESWHAVYSSMYALSKPLVLGDNIVAVSGDWDNFSMYYTPKLDWE